MAGALAHRRVLFAALLVLAFGCSTAAPPGAAAGNGSTVWLCRPGLADDPCLSSLTATLVEPDGRTRVVRTRPAAHPAVDCFYVYPTISPQPTVNANLAIDFQESEVAVAQASRFSQVCRVYAPVYPQITLSALRHPAEITLADALRAYQGVLDAFEDYLAHYNHGRGIVFIGHSQGALILIRLLAAHVDDDPSLRRRLVSALLLGGNLAVAPPGRGGGDFAHIPACRSRTQTGCVVAYSSFTSPPTRASEFGLATSNAGVGILHPRASAPGVHVLCVNPASPASGGGWLEPYVPSLVLAFLGTAGVPAVATPWVAFPHAYRARCASAGDANWLEVTHVGATPDLLTRLQDPALGLHILDVNIALGNLVALVGAEAAAYHHA